MGDFGDKLKRQNSQVKTRFLEHPNVLDASVSRFTVAARNRQAFRFPETPDQQLRFMGIDDRYLGLFDIPILEGRTFPPTFADQWEENKEMEFIVSKSLVEKMNWEEPIGKIVELWENWTVLAVVYGFLLFFCLCLRRHTFFSAAKRKYVKKCRHGVEWSGVTPFSWTVLVTVF